MTRCFWMNILLTLAFLKPALCFCENSCVPFLSANATPSVRTLLKSFRALQSERLKFEGVGQRDVYNPTQPFLMTFGNRKIQVMAARVEARDSEQSQVMFFTETAQPGVWSRLNNTPIFQLQDPFFTFINHELIFGGVEISARPSGGYGYRTVFFRAQTLDDLDPMEPFLRGPEGMKDIRLVQISSNAIGVLTRPQGFNVVTGVNAGPGRIGFSIVRSLDALNTEVIANAPLIEGQFKQSEWGGANEAQMLDERRIAVLAHVARFDAKRNRHYYAAVFTLDVLTGQVSPFEIILERRNLVGGLRGASKRPDLKDVIFSGGMELREETAVLYVGAGDAEVHKKVIPLPSLFR